MQRAARVADRPKQPFCGGRVVKRLPPPDHAAAASFGQRKSKQGDNPFGNVLPHCFQRLVFVELVVLAIVHNLKHHAQMPSKAARRMVLAVIAAAVKAPAKADTEKSAAVLPATMRR